MRVTAACALRTAAQAASVSLLCALAYRCVQRLRENSITVYVTELVRLPPVATTLPLMPSATAAVDGTSTAAAYAAALSPPQRHYNRGNITGSNVAAANATRVEVEGAIEVHTYLTCGYRFALKLCASWSALDTCMDSSVQAVARNAVAMTATQRKGRRNGGVNNALAYSLHRRAVQTAAAVMRPHTRTTWRNKSSSDSEDKDDGTLATSHDNTLAVHNANVSVDALRAPPAGATLSKHHRDARHGGRDSSDDTAVLQIVHVDAMVDCCELAESGVLCFTPACVSTTSLLTYRTSTHVHLPYSSSAATSPTSTVAAAATAVVHGCYLQLDGSTRTAQRLSLDICFTGPLHNVHVVLTLPHARCRVRRVYTCNTGTVRLQPHHPYARGSKLPCCVWQLGYVDECTCGGRDAHNNATLQHGSVQEEDGDDKAAALDTASALLQARVRVCHFVLVYEQPAWDAADGEDVTTAAASRDADGIVQSSRQQQQLQQTDNVSDNDGADNASNSDADVEGGDDDGAVLAAAQTHASSRARKRAARAQQRQYMRARQQRIRTGQRDSATQLPSVELRYTTLSLASGAVVRRLQVREEHSTETTAATSPLRLRLPTWLRAAHSRDAAATATPHSKLTKLAHYTTCYVQPILVTPL